MQLETADFAPVPPPGEMDETLVVFNSGPFAPICENIWHPQNRKHCRQRRTEPRVTCAENWVKFGPMVLEKRQWTNKQTDRQTDRHARS